MESRRALLIALCEFRRCPNTGRILAGARHDDKVLCGCRRPNPRIARPWHGGDPEHGHEDGGAIHHIKEFLEPATVDDYLAQEARDRMGRG